MAARRKAAPAGRAPSANKKPWFGARGGCVQLGAQLTQRMAWGDPTEPLFQEYVAREYLEGGMPIVELQRNHGLPRSSVKKWIGTYRQAGRGGLVRAAADARIVAEKREQRLAKTRVKSDELAGLSAMINSHDVGKKRAAYSVVRKRRLDALVPAILGVVKWANTQREVSIQDELELLAELKATTALHELLISKMQIVRRYQHGFARLFKRAGCALRTVKKPWCQQYELDGKWYPIKGPR